MLGNNNNGSQFNLDIFKIKFKETKIHVPGHTRPDSEYFQSMSNGSGEWVTVWLSCPPWKHDSLLVLYLNSRTLIYIRTRYYLSCRLPLDNKIMYYCQTSFVLSLLCLHVHLFIFFLYFSF